MWKSYKLNFSAWNLFAALSSRRNCFFLDSSLQNQTLGRYSIVGCDPFKTVIIKRNNPFGELRELLEKYRLATGACPLPFCGGAVGYLNYDLGFALEKKFRPLPKPYVIRTEGFFGFYNCAAVVDNLKQRLYLVSTGFPEKNSHAERLLAKENFKKLQRLADKAATLKDRYGEKNIYSPIKLQSNFTRRDYLAAVKKAKDYIRKGDIYQVNLAQSFQARTELSAQEIYRRLRQISPSCFSAYFDAGSHQLISSSPERFLSLYGDRVLTRPMKGTRPRSSNAHQDYQLKKELLSSAKDKAELTMIVDLERNDLGKVCRYNSVKVERLRELEAYSTVYQTTATIEGRLHPRKDRIDLLRACFPGGSITGCPKIRAMEIIDELEPTRRAIYTGCLGYLSFSGGMDFNILIRTILKAGEKLYFSVGGGIVADSHPQAEYQETMVKAKAMIEAINGSRA